MLYFADINIKQLQKKILATPTRAYLSDAEDEQIRQSIESRSISYLTRKIVK